ncbi:MAG: hypothetical protein HFI09_03850 [Bacilli bacterium]|nr:hypothetical protein [Bacilli bacterium]
MEKLWFVVSWNPWFFRSYDFHNGTEAGVFAFGNTYSSVSLYVSFRVI